MSIGDHRIDCVQNVPLDAYYVQCIKRWERGKILCVFEMDGALQVEYFVKYPKRRMIVVDGW